MVRKRSGSLLNDFRGRPTPYGPISPPPSRRRETEASNQTSTAARVDTPTTPTTPTIPSLTSKSPFRLIKVKGLNDAANVDTISLEDILGRPSICQAWIFSYTVDLDFTLSKFDKSISKTIPIYITHGSREDGWTYQHILAWKEKQAAVWPNVHITRVQPKDRMGTHHSKMIILFFDTPMGPKCQIIIHTANMILFDWTNMTQGAWLSPMLPKLPFDHSDVSEGFPVIGTGERFKTDLLHYLEAKAYVDHCVPLREHLARYEFSSVRGALVSSVPGIHGVNLSESEPRKLTASGWLGLRQVLEAVPPWPQFNTSQSQQNAKDNIIVQVSSIAKLGTTWENDFWAALRKLQSQMMDSQVKVMWPCAKHVKDSLNGYASGGSIHMKSRGPIAKAQLDRFEKLFVCWYHDVVDPDDDSQPRMAGSHSKQNAFRREAAPHIKTYIRFDSEYKSIRWALLTSANLSTQAWGTTDHVKPVKKAKIASFEIGVMVWPELFQNGQKNVKMVPVFGRDDIDSVQGSVVDEIPLRMPYGLPLGKEKPRLHGKPWTTDSHFPEADR